MWRSIEMLQEDHQMTIQRAWPIIYSVVIQMKQGREVSAQTLSEIVEFLDGFMLGHHMLLEEAFLYLAHEHSVDRQDEMLGKVMMEHVRARNMVETLSDTLQAAAMGSESARESFTDNGAHLIDFFLRHESEEDTKLFPFMEGILNEADDQALLEKAGVTGTEEDIHVHFEHLLQRIQREILQ